MKATPGFMVIELMKSGLELLYSQAQSVQGGHDEEEARSAMVEFNTATPATMLDIATVFAGGGQYEDGFGAWSDADTIELAPSTYSPAGRRCWGYCKAVAEINGASIDYVLIGHDDVWASRLSKDGTEVAGTRFKCGDLGECIMASIEKALDLGFNDLPEPEQPDPVGYAWDPGLTDEQNEALECLAELGCSAEDLAAHAAALRAPNKEEGSVPRQRAGAETLADY